MPEIRLWMRVPCYAVSVSLSRVVVLEKDRSRRDGCLAKAAGLGASAAETILTDHACVRGSASTFEPVFLFCLFHIPQGFKRVARVTFHLGAPSESTTACGKPQKAFATSTGSHTQHSKCHEWSNLASVSGVDATSSVRCRICQRFENSMAGCWAIWKWMSSRAEQQRLLSLAVVSECECMQARSQINAAQAETRNFACRTQSQAEALIIGVMFMVAEVRTTAW